MAGIWTDLEWGSITLYCMVLFHSLVLSCRFITLAYCILFFIIVLRTLLRSSGTYALLLSCYCHRNLQNGGSHMICFKSTLMHNCFGFASYQSWIKVCTIIDGFRVYRLEVSRSFTWHSRWYNSVEGSVNVQLGVSSVLTGSLDSQIGVVCLSHQARVNAMHELIPGKSTLFKFSAHSSSLHIIRQSRKIIPRSIFTKHRRTTNIWTKNLIPPTTSSHLSEGLLHVNKSASNVHTLVCYADELRWYNGVRAQHGILSDSSNGAFDMNAEAGNLLARKDFRLRW